MSLVAYEGDQHDLLQFVSDFFQFYHLPTSSIELVANEVLKRLPNTELQIPVSISAKRLIQLRLGLKDNITNVVEGFSSVYEIFDESMKLAIIKRARLGMAPGSYLV